MGAGLFTLEELPPNLRAQAERELGIGPTVFDDPFPEGVLEGGGPLFRCFIPGNVPSLKNGKRIFQIGKKGDRRPMLVPHRRVEQYKKDTGLDFAANAHGFKLAARRLPRPLRIEFRFVRGSRHRFDYSNALDTVQDLMVWHGWIPDDNADELIPVIKPYSYDKACPGVEISLTAG